MPSPTSQSPRLQHARDRQLISRAADEAGKFDVRRAEIATPSPRSHPGYDAQLNPIDDEFINTHGSER